MVSIKTVVLVKIEDLGFISCFLEQLLVCTHCRDRVWPQMAFSDQNKGHNAIYVPLNLEDII